MPRFEARVGGDDAPEPGAVPFLEVPAAVMAALRPGKRPPVRVSFNGHTYRTTVAVYGGRFYLPVNRANLEAARAALGDRVTVVLERDLEPREVSLAPELEAALAAEPLLRANFERGSYTERKEQADRIATAKQPATKARRLQKLLDSLR